jgi:phage baseplate assembly protein W
MAITRADKYTSSDRKNQIYSDFLSNLSPHPQSLDIVRATNDVAVIRSIRNLINTNKGDRLYQPKIGCGIREMLFEPMGPDTALTIKQQILSTIESSEPRAKIVDIKCLPNYGADGYDITVVFMLINRQEPVTTSITLYRVR